MQEIDMHEPIKNFLCKKGYLCYSEVPMLSRVIDVVGLGNDIVAVELKLNAWKKALSQAIAYRLVADYSYVAIPKKIIKNINVKYFDRFGIGIICFSDEIKIMKEARQCKYHQSVRNEMLQYIEGLGR